MKRPVILVVANRTTRKDKLIDYVGELHLELLTRLGALPVIVPVVDGTLACLPQYREQMDGLLLVEGDDVEPKRFAARISMPPIWAAWNLPRCGGVEQAAAWPPEPRPGGNAGLALAAALV